MGWTRSKAHHNGRHSEVETFSGSTLPAPWGANSSSTGVVQTDIDANATTVTDQAGKLRRSITNGLGQLIRVDEPTGGGLGTVGSPNQATSYAYDTLNNLTTVTQGSQTRTFTYSSLSRLLSATNPESGTISYGYDSNGNLIEKIDARSIETTYTYDALNRVTARDYDDSTPDVDYTYGTSAPKIGKLVKVESSVSTTEYTAFDILGRVTGHKQTTDGQQYTTGYTYSLSGQLLEETYPSGRVVKNTYDTADGSLSQIQSKRSSETYRNLANGFNYNAAGAVTSMRLGNGLWETTQFNARLQPTQIGLGSGAASQNKLKLQYGYGTTENNGNVLSQTITVPGLAHPFVQNYTYDSLNRITSAEETSNSAQTWKQAYTFDRYGNRNFDEEETTTLQKNCGTEPNSEVCSADVPIVNPTVNTANNKLNGTTYDAAGNVITDAEGRQFTYDAENKQIEVESSEDETIGQYYFDGDGKRVKKVVPNGETTIFVYDASGRLMGEYSTEVQPSQDAKTQYLTNDHLGTPRINTNSIGQVISRSDYLPYGEEIVGLGGRSSGEDYVTDDVRQGFTGYENDAETGLDYAQARMYSSLSGRMISPDPLYFQSMMAIDPQRFNLYLYTRNNPLKWTDPDGEKLYLRGNTAWLQTNVLYQMAGTQEDFDKYFEIKDGQVLQRSGVDISAANAGIQELAGIVGDAENYVYFAGTEASDLNALFKDATDAKGRLTSVGKTIANQFSAADGRLTGGGTFVRTNGRDVETPANLANGDAVFAVIAYNTNASQTQEGVSSEISGFSNVEVATQKEGVGQIVKPVSFFIHESTENREFARQKRQGQAFDYKAAHTHGMQREASLRKALGITGGFAGGALVTTINKKK